MSLFRATVSAECLLSLLRALISVEGLQTLFLFPVSDEGYILFLSRVKSIWSLPQRA